MREPDLKGNDVEAWAINPTSGRPSAHLKGFLLRYEGAHPFWNRWVVYVCHLREMEGVDPPKKRYPEAEYEFGIVTLNPEHEVDLEAIEAGKDHFKFLMPPDVTVQFHGISDRDAERLCNMAMDQLINRRISPDQDYRRVWIELINGTVEHVRQGAHPEN